MAASFKKVDNYSSKNEINEEVFHILCSLFGNLLHTDVIKSVGLNCNWDLQSTCNILADISNTVVTDHGQVQSKNKTGNIVQRQSNDDDNQDVIVENEIFDDVNDSKFIPQYGTKFSTRPKGISYAEKSIGRGNMIPRITRVKAQPKQVQNKSKRELEFERVKKLILTGAKVLVLLRGPPGSGKSYLAKILIEQTMQEDYRRFVFSTDDYFVINGVYQFNPTSVSEAHSWNHSRVREVMQMGISPVVVDNTNTQMWEMRPYLHFAVTFGYAVELLEPFTSWLYNPQELARRNCHSVPKAKIVEILERYDRKITTEQLFATYKLKYHPSKQPPQPRLYPPMRKNRPIKFDIPNSIRRDTPSPNPNAPKQKRLRKRNLHTKSEGTSVPESFEMISSNSMISMQSLEYSTSSESDEESSSTNNVGYKGPDILSSDIKECTEYVLVMPDSTRIYQKSHIDTENKNEHNIDLINFNDSESTIKNPTVTEDLINLNTDSNEDKPENNQDMMPQPVMEQFSSLNISKPQVYNEQEGQSVSTPNLYPKLDLSAWGLSENPLISWESDKILKQEICKYKCPQPQRNVMKNMYPNYVDSTTNTSSSDFNLVKQDRIGPEHGRIVSTCIRDINEYTLIAAPKPPLITVFDKSTMTTEEDLLQPLTSSAESEKHAKVFSALVNLFPQTPPDDLREIYDKCKGDINWTVDLLLDSNMVSVSQNIVPKNKNILDTSENKQVNDIIQNISIETEHNTSETSEDSTKMCSPESKKISNRFKNKVPFSEESLELKRQIEEHVKINDAHYSEHLLNIRRKKHGEVEPCQSGIALVNKISESLPQFTTQDTCSEDDESEEEIIEVNVGMDFIQKMECSLEVGNVDYPEGLQPIMNIPASLLKQLHAYWLESVYQQMEAYAKVVEKMVNEDEELARRLQQEEESAVDNKEPVVPDLQEIMDMEIALAIYRSDQKQLKAETPDDLATRIKRQKLFETFPKLDSNTLTEILQAHDNCFEQTMEVLMSSVGDTTTVNIDKCGIENLQKQKELIENAKKEYVEVKQANSIKKEGNETVPQEDCETNSAEDYREAAAHHLKMRQIYFNKAKTALQKKWTQVATYYLDMAKLHKQKYELANGRAASAFLNSHFYNHQNSNTLDLHYLYVKEAEQALAMYLDSRILKLKESIKQKENIYIITGRGKHSKNGISQIKPAIQRKLRERKIDFAEVNPGLLKVRIKRDSIMTNDLKN